MIFGIIGVVLIIGFVFVVGLWEVREVINRADDEDFLE